MISEAAPKFPLNTHLSLIHGHAAASLVRNRCDLDAQSQTSKRVKIVKASHVLWTRRSINGETVGWWEKNANHFHSKSHSPSVATCNTLIIQALHERCAAVRRLHNRRCRLCLDSTKTRDFHPNGCLTLTWIGESETLALAISTSQDVWKLVVGLMQFVSLTGSNQTSSSPGINRLIQFYCSSTRLLWISALHGVPSSSLHTSSYVAQIPDKSVFPSEKDSTSAPVRTATSIFRSTHQKNNYN